MDVNAHLAGGLYRNAIRIARPDGSSPTALGRQGGEQDFTKSLRDSALETLRQIRGAEKTAKAGIAGRADAQSVVQALAETQLAVETASIVRNKVVEAYNEILRMPV